MRTNKRRKTERRVAGKHGIAGRPAGYCRAVMGTAVGHYVRPRRSRSMEQAVAGQRSLRDSAEKKLRERAGETSRIDTHRGEEQCKSVAVDRVSKKSFLP